MSILNLQLTNKDTDICNNNKLLNSNPRINYVNKICVKPWGHEFLVYESKQIGIWYLKINKGHSTSLHCHFNKDTNIIVISGSAKIETIDNCYFANTMTVIHIPKNKFHAISAFSDEVYVLEIEKFHGGDFSDKNDLLRITDQYKRETTGYEKSVTISKELDKYEYFYLDKGFNQCIKKVYISVSNELINSVHNIILDGYLFDNIHNYYLGSGSFVEYKNKSIYTGNATILSLNKLDYKEDGKIIYDLDQLKVLKKNNLQNKKVILTSGCFDILHIGHLDILRKSKALGDVLIVCLSNDEQIKALKGKDRPINNYEDRLELFKTISYVDYIVLYREEDIQRELTLDYIMKIIDPNVWTKGSDYTVENIREKHPSLQNIHIFQQLENKSTTNIIKKINNKLPEESSLGVSSADL